MQQKNTSDKQIKNFNVQNNNLHKQVALHHIVCIRSLHHSGSNKLAPFKTMNLCLDTSRQGIKLQTLSAKQFFELGTQVFVHPVHFEFYQLAVEHF